MGNKRTSVDLHGVEKTLLIPLWGRAKETEKDDPLIVDAHAKEVLEKVDYDFSKMESGFSEVERLTWVIRAYHFDNTVRKFVSNHPNALIVNIGAGLDTTFHRIDDGKVRWVNIDLPDVISLRKSLMPGAARDITIGKSVFDFSWIDDIRPMAEGAAIMIIAAGLLCYFEEEQVKKLFCKIADEYPEAHLVFDSFPWFVAWSWNRELKKGKKGKLDSAVSPLKWYLGKASKLKGWVDTLNIIDEYPMCSRIELKKEWGKKLIFQMKMINWFRLYNMTHVQFAAAY